MTREQQLADLCWRWAACEVNCLDGRHLVEETVQLLAPTTRSPLPIDRSGQLEAVAADLNHHFPVGTRCLVWPGAKEGPGIPTRIRAPWSVLGGHTVVAWVENVAACIAATHVELVPEEAQ